MVLFIKTKWNDVAVCKWCVHPLLTLLMGTSSFHRVKFLFYGGHTNCLGFSIHLIVNYTWMYWRMNMWDECFDDHSQFDIRFSRLVLSLSILCLQIYEKCIFVSNIQQELFQHTDFLNGFQMNYLSLFTKLTCNYLNRCQLHTMWQLISIFNASISQTIFYYW